MSTYLSLYVLHITTEPGGVALKLRATSHSCYVMRCVQPGRILGLARPHLRPCLFVSVLATLRKSCWSNLHDFSISRYGFTLKFPFEKLNFESYPYQDPDLRIFGAMQDISFFNDMALTERSAFCECFS